MTHDELVIRAERWLRAVGCGVTFRELVASVTSGEIPDAIGWRNQRSILIECKTSRSDFFADRAKRFRVRPEDGMGDWRFFMTPPKVVHPEDLPPGWGLLWAMPKTVLRVHGLPSSNTGWGRAPMKGNRNNEAALMLSALRRLTIRGHIETIYDPDPRNETPANT